MANPDITKRPSKWRILTSSGGAINLGYILEVGGTTGRLYISKTFEDDETSPGVVTLSYVGAGRGIGAPSPLPGEVSYSTASMPSNGYIYHGALSSGSDIELHDLTGLCVIRVSSAALGVSVSLTEIFFRPATFAMPTRCKAVGIVFGKGRGTPGLGVMEYTGHMRIGKVNPLTSKDPIDHALRPPHFRIIPPELNLPADVLFDFDRSDLKPAADPLLKKAAQLIARQRVRSAIIEGHTDSKGNEQYNLRLSSARANAVKSWLVQQQVPHSASFITKGFGESQPLAPNSKPDGRDNPEGRRQNRRVSINLVP